MNRPSWDEYFLQLAKSIATRSTCDRGRSGSIIVRDKRILCTGYVGSPSGMPHCDEAGHLMENDHCVATIHSEANAVLQAAKNGVMINNSEIYITASPCWTCFKMLANAGIKKIYYGEFYRDERIFHTAKKLGIELKHIKVDQSKL